MNKNQKIKIDPARVEETFQWMEEVLGEKLEHDLQSTLKDGIVLLKLMSKITGNEYKIEKSTLAFKQMENITRFLNEAKKVGVPDMEIFVTLDLYEAKNLNKVIECIGSLARNAHQKGYSVPLLGPKLADANVRHFSDEKLREGRAVSSFLTSNERSAQYAMERAGGELIPQPHMPRQVADQRVDKPISSEMSQLTNMHGPQQDAGAFGKRREIGGEYK
eukprot:NODE_201_length_13147_cov_1.076104.p8 type:complete len:219 gc:universal NODE_201_length_13147_cov_1.076104:5207-5863(+)